MNRPQASAAPDLAAVALRHAREDARASRFHAHSTHERHHYRGSATPMPAQAVFAEMLAVLGEVPPLAPLARWREIMGAPLASVLAAVEYSARTGVLTLEPVDIGWSRLVEINLSKEIISSMNAALGASTVRRIRLLPPGAGLADFTNEQPRSTATCLAFTWRSPDKHDGDEDVALRAAIARQADSATRETAHVFPGLNL
ncbi:DciA family protein [Streptomyces zaomyceticus]|uniref:DciA family protein n=1 Tax=Streptomyces zaomyceticus TaxID=68286 RepID=UPI0036D0E89C